MNTVNKPQENSDANSVCVEDARPNESSGRGLMEVIVGILVIAIVGSIFLHVIKLGIKMYTLNSTSGAVAEELNRAREIAIKENRKVSVIFDVQQNVYGIDLNGNGFLDGGEAEQMPDGLSLSDSTSVTFMPSGTLPPKSQDPHIGISNSRNSRSVSVSSIGAVSVE